ncbi:chemotaxis protein CheX [Sphaerotilus microaerophilus]|uniref:Chemotaxis phosphatase CheX-like domain-containing protein n=1 Tax=Sphaerotilus microaerophilus TaxID=2914710 RepID=A0ABN6PP19_9BURK|nr:chemotaxis protein CheX [Sphaerotilus sp. FB-5]BDI05605.1 hypothetical protein CATMQ487_25750 [Sphaerotilus sp. FB-5]
MNDTAQLISKVLVLEGDSACHDRIKAFCEDNHLLPLKAYADNVMSVLKSNVDLGAIFLSERFNDQSDGGILLGRSIHAARPELPIFLRRNEGTPIDLSDLPEPDRDCFSAGYTAARMHELQPSIDRCIFSLVYPHALVRGIEELTLVALRNQFIDIEVDVQPPQVVRDRIIFGELFSLMPLESDWGRGYLMLQTEEQALMDFVRQGKTLLPADYDSFRDVNNVLADITNLVWGTFKNRFVVNDTGSGHLTQVPIIVNHQHRYISFGSDDPQLCFRYTLRDPDPANPVRVVLDQRFVFNLRWLPDNFRENEAAIDALVHSGGLELF